MKYLLLYTVESLICLSRLWYNSKTIPYKITIDSRQEKLYSSLQWIYNKHDVLYTKISIQYFDRTVDPKNNSKLVHDNAYSKRFSSHKYRIVHCVKNSSRISERKITYRQ
jgi:hypothetical protein